jgi:hypothetical protein
MSTIYASYSDPAAAERAAGALIDQGAPSEAISVVANELYAGARGDTLQSEAHHLEHEAKTGISVTTPADAAMGAAKGLTVGLGVGVLAALAALTIPGLGLVLGTGALATAIAGATATAVAGAAAGGVYGYLKDQGMSEDIVAGYSQVVESGGAILALTVPAGNLDTAQAEGILTKYGAANVFTQNQSSNGPYLSNNAPEPPIVSLRDGTTGRVVPTETIIVETVEPRTGVVAHSEFAASEPTVIDTTDPLTGTVSPVTAVSQVRPTRIDPETGAATDGVVIDPVTGRERQVRIENGQVIYLS